MSRKKKAGHPGGRVTGSGAKTNHQQSSRSGNNYQPSHGQIRRVWFEVWDSEMASFVLCPIDEVGA